MHRKHLWIRALMHRGLWRTFAVSAVARPDMRVRVHEIMTIFCIYLGYMNKS